MDKSKEMTFEKAMKVGLMLEGCNIYNGNYDLRDQACYVLSKALEARRHTLQTAIEELLERSKAVLEKILNTSRKKTYSTGQINEIHSLWNDIDGALNPIKTLVFHCETCDLKFTVHDASQDTLDGVACPCCRAADAVSKLEEPTL